MSAAPSPRPRRRPRRGSLERPVSGRTYRGTWLLVALPLLLAAFTVSRPAPLPQPQLPAEFDTPSAVTLATQLAGSYADRSPGTPGAIGAAQWVSDQLRPYGFVPHTDTFDANVAGRGRLRFENVYAVAPGRSQSEIVVLAHHDNTGASAGANDNASGTAALIELARSYANPAASSSTPSTSRRISPAHTIVFLSTDGGALGGVGAAHFVAHSPLARDVIAVIDLDSIAGAGRPRIEIAGDRPRSPSTGLVATTAARVLEQTGNGVARPSALRQLLDLAFPFSFYEQAPFIGHGISAVTLTTAGDRPPSSLGDTPDKLHAARLGQVGRSAQQLLASLDEGLELAQGTSSYVFLGARVVHGWAIELVFVAALLPFLAVAVDIFAFVRRRRIAFAPALRSLRSRFAFWIWLALAFELVGLAGFWPHSSLRAPAPEASAGTDWPIAGLIVFAVLALVGWFVARDRLLPRRAVTSEEELAGHAAALLALGFVAVLTVSVNAFALLLLLPSLHAWLWLPQVRRGPLLPRLATFLLGFAGPALLLWEFARRFGLGFDAPWYLLQLVALGRLSPVAIALVVAWAAAAGQLAALTAGRYAPYPGKSERPPLGPVRRTIRRAVLSNRKRRRARLAAAPDDEVNALHG
ncbi:MAG: M28 family metallopeptidase [Gaiellaceae bacterium]